ncbi:sugar transferase [Nonomuraea fuscirosea]|uniref:sugar transferase n=1 Tax=Nonomuraea fuscirosea TaxID=1291556 RepID=UPI0034363AC0
MAVSIRAGRQFAWRAGARRAGHRRAVQPLGLVGVDVVCMTFTAAGAGPDLRRIAVAGIVVLALNGAGRVYAPRVVPSCLDRGLWLAGSGLVSVLVAFWGAASLVEVTLFAGLFTFLAVCGRSVLCLAVRRARERGRSAPTLVVGAGAHGHRLADILLAHPEHGLLPVGFLDEGAGESRCVPVLGGLSDVTDIVQTHGVRAVVIAGAARQSFTRTARALGCEVYLAPDPDDVIVDFVALREHVRSFPLLRMRPEAQRRATWPMKRVLDVAVALTGLVLTAPILAVCALMVRSEVGPKLLFRQQRVGLGGGPIELLKLRTMRPADPHESATLWSIADDHRVGPVGRSLRRTSADELPQLWNVLQGSMSIVGPRPERPHFVEQFSRTIPGYELRHRLPVGLTGWAQIHGLRGDTSIEDRARFDNYYVDGWTLRSDIKIMMRTLWCLLRRSGS